MEREHLLTRAAVPFRDPMARPAPLNPEGRCLEQEQCRKPPTPGSGDGCALDNHQTVNKTC